MLPPAIARISIRFFIVCRSTPCGTTPTVSSLELAGATADTIKCAQYADPPSAVCKAVTSLCCQRMS